MTKATARNDLGFTLVEVLVVLVVLALLTGLGTEALRTAADGWRRIETRDADAEELQSMTSLLRGLFSQIRPEKAGEGRRRVVRFSGEAHQAAFLAPLPERLGAADIGQYLVHAPADGTLRIAWRLDRDIRIKDQGPIPGAEETLEGLTNTAFAYFGPGEDGESQWWETWNDRQTLPALIRVRFSFRGKEQELLIAPAIDGIFCSAFETENDCSK